MYRTPKKNVHRKVVAYEDTIPLGTDQVLLTTASFTDKGTVMGWDLYVGWLTNDQVAAGAQETGSMGVYVSRSNENRSGFNTADNNINNVDKEWLFTVPMMSQKDLHDIKHLKSRSKRKFNRGDNLYLAAESSAASANCKYYIYGIFYISD